MDLSKKDRMILRNQYKILQVVDDNPHNADHYEKMISVLENGYELHYGWETEEFAEGLSVDACSEINSIMAMYDALQRSYDNLEDDDQDGIDKADLRFEGFDGNNETAEMGYARFVIEQDGRFGYLDRKDDLNSHMHMLPKYRGMLTVWKNNKDESHELSKQDIQDILGASPREGGWADAEGYYGSSY